MVTKALLNWLWIVKCSFSSVRCAWLWMFRIFLSCISANQTVKWSIIRAINHCRVRVLPLCGVLPSHVFVICLQMFYVELVFSFAVNNQKILFIPDDQDKNVWKCVASNNFRYFFNRYVNVLSSVLQTILVTLYIIYYLFTCFKFKSTENRPSVYKPQKCGSNLSI